MGSAIADQIDRDFRNYRQERNERQAEKILDKLLRLRGTADRLVCRVVARKFGVAPTVFTREIEFVEKKAASTYWNSSQFMADSVRVDALAEAANTFRQERRGERKDRDGNPAKPIQHGAAYLVSIAFKSCGKTLKYEDPAEAQLREWFDGCLYPPKKIDPQKAELFPFYIDNTSQHIGLKNGVKHKRPLLGWRVRLLLEAPRNVLIHVPFDRVMITKPAQLKERLVDILAWCGTAVSRQDLWEIVRSLYAISTSSENARSITENLTLGTSAEDQLMARQNRNLLYEMIQQLSDKQRTAIHLFYFEQMSCEEIAQVMQKKVNDVHQYLNYGRKNLRKKAKLVELEQEIANVTWVPAGRSQFALQEEVANV